MWLIWDYQNLCLENRIKQKVCPKDYLKEKDAEQNSSTKERTGHPNGIGSPKYYKILRNLYGCHVYSFHHGVL